MFVQLFLVLAVMISALCESFHHIPRVVGGIRISSSSPHRLQASNQALVDWLKREGADVKELRVNLGLGDQGGTTALGAIRKGNLFVVYTHYTTQQYTTLHARTHTRTH